VPADAEVAAVADRRPEQQLARADEQRDERQREEEPTQGVGRASPPSLSPQHVQHREQRRRAGLLRERGERDRDPGRESAAAPRQQHRQRHAREHEDLEVRCLPVLRRERDGRQHHEQARDPSGAVAPASASLEREEQRGERDGEHRHHSYRPQGCRAEQRERARVQVGDEGRLAVGGVLVQLAAVPDDVGLGGEERLVRVEHVDREGRQPQRGRQHE
jgi:hypothetical protein